MLRLSCGMRSLPSMGWRVPMVSPTMLNGNHCQPTRLKIVLPANPLRQTVTADGPIDLKNMFAAGDRTIESLDAILDDFVSSGFHDFDGARTENDDVKHRIAGTSNGFPNDAH